MADSASATRAYHSPLREQQARGTRAQILDALVDLINDVGAHDLNVKELARRAGVAERTVYRHFADRAALLDGLVEYLDETADWLGPGDIRTVDDVAPTLAKCFQVYDDFVRETRALVLMNLDPARTATRTRRHVEQIDELVATLFADLDDADRAGIAALFGLLLSSRTWLRMLDGNGLPGTESARYLGWLADLMIEAVESGRLPSRAR